MEIAIFGGCLLVALAILVGVVFFVFRYLFGELSSVWALIEEFRDLVCEVEGKSSALERRLETLERSAEDVEKALRDYKVWKPESSGRLVEEGPGFEPPSFNQWLATTDFPERHGIREEE